MSKDMSSSSSAMIGGGVTMRRSERSSDGSMRSPAAIGFGRAGSFSVPNSSLLKS
ncbi:hypothetical protein D3C71_2227560 [compost metagenome]